MSSISSPCRYKRNVSAKNHGHLSYNNFGLKSQPTSIFSSSYAHQISSSKRPFNVYCQITQQRILWSERPFCITHYYTELYSTG